MWSMVVVSRTIITSKSTVSVNSNSFSLMKTVIAVCEKKSEAENNVS